MQRYAIARLFVTTAFLLRGSLPAAAGSDWISADIGATNIPGSATLFDSVWTVQGDGANIWGTTDAFHYVYRTGVGSDASLSVRIDHLNDTSSRAKAGLMLRTSTNPNAATIILDVKPDGGIEFMLRSADGGTMAYVGGVAATFPVWLRLNWFCGNDSCSYTDVVPAISEDAIQWNSGFAPSRTLVMPASGYLAGLAVTSHNTAELTTARAERLDLLLPTFADTDIGAVSIPSNAACQTIPPQASTGMNMQCTIQADGSNVWGTDDSFAFVNAGPNASSLSLAWRWRVDSLTDTSPSAKAGLMFRDALTPDAAMVIADMKPNGELEFMARICHGCSVNYLGGAFVPFPAYVSLARSGSTFTVQVGSSPASLKPVGTIEVPMSTVYYGFAVTSHNAGQLTTAVFTGEWFK